MKKRIYNLIALFFIILLILAILSFRDKSIHNLSNNTVVSIEDLHSENIINDTSFYKIYGVSRHDSYPNALNVSIVNISEEIDKVELFNNKGERLKIEDFTINRNTLNLTIKDLDTEENDAFYLKLYNKAGDFKKINLVENSNTVIKQNGYTDCKIITRIIDYQDGKMVKESSGIYNFTIGGAYKIGWVSYGVEKVGSHQVTWKLVLDIGKHIILHAGF